jgi:hypothetical protein
VNHDFTLVQNSIYSTKLEKHASLKALPDKKYSSEDGEIFHMKQFTNACTDKLTPMWNNRVQNYNRLKTGHVLPRRLYVQGRYK